MTLARDPMSAILSESAYQKYCELKHPNEPPGGLLDQLVKVLTPEEKKVALLNAKMLAEHGKTFVTIVGKNWDPQPEPSEPLNPKMLANYSKGLIAAIEKQKI